MATSKPCELSFRSLEQALNRASLCKDEYAKLLNDHQKCIFDTLKKAFASFDEVSSSKAVTYRPGLPTTKTHPQPVETESSCIESMYRFLELSRANAGILLRDYFLEEFGNDRLSKLLDDKVDFESLVPMKDLGNFWRKECRAAFSVMLTIFANARPSSTFPQKHVCRSFLAKHKVILMELLVNLATRSIAQFGATALGSKNAEMRYLDPVWALEVFFCKRHALRAGAIVFCANY